MSAVWFNLNTVEMMTVEHYTYLQNLVSYLHAIVTVQFWRIGICYLCLETTCLFISLFWLRCLKYTRAGTCMIQIL